MKRLTPKRRRYLMRVTQRRTARRRRRLFLQSEAASPRTRRVMRIGAPRIFGVVNRVNRLELTKFLRALTRAVLVQERRVRIEFANTKSMTPGGTLLFAAELNRIVRISKERLLSCSFPRDDVVAQVLKHVGIFDMLGQRRDCNVTADNVKYWRAHSGSDVDGQAAGEAILNYMARFSDPGKRAVYKGLTEAMTNCRHHAYQAERGDGLPSVNRWWMFSQELDGQLTVAICDLGIGIPRSLREDRAGWYGEIVAFLAKSGWTSSDGDLISAAIAIGETRTQEKYRGKGLMDIRTVLDELGGSLQIHSNSGFYVYEAKTKKATWKTFDASILGTLVIWQVPLPAPAPP